MKDAYGRHHAPNGKYSPQLISTSRGPLTRKQIAEIAGIPLNTVHSRMHRKVSEEELFAPRKVSKTVGKPKRGTRTRDTRRSHEDSNYIETWEQRKQRRAREKAGIGT